jgi:hypothetical protein
LAWRGRALFQPSRRCSLLHLVSCNVYSNLYGGKIHHLSLILCSYGFVLGSRRLLPKFRQASFIAHCNNWRLRGFFREIRRSGMPAGRVELGFDLLQKRQL